MNEVVIKPPEGMVRGKTFRPSRKLLYKEYTEVIILAVFLWAIVILSWMGLAYLISIDDGWSYTAYMNALFWPVNFWMWVFNAIWLVPYFVIAPFYIRSIEYSVIAESGEAMPEIYVKKGILNVTRKHVPFRTITNMSSRAGPFDRLFGIGSLRVHTAGFSGGTQAGEQPEASLDGLTFYDELRIFMLKTLRRYEHFNEHDSEYLFGEESTQLEILKILQEIRDLLRQRSL
jgi:membrane protein YdbS with pleckstrin-like domain